MQIFFKKVVFVQMFNSFLKFIKKITPRFIKELVRALNPKNRVRYISHKEAVINCIRNRHLKYRQISIEEVKKKYKKSDTIFILGSAESINDVTKEQWDYISKHDSFGINWWPVHHFVPSFYQTACPRNPQFRKRLGETILRKKFAYRDTIFFVSDRAIKKGMHPRILPDFFSENPICCFYKYPKKIIKKETKGFKKSDFNAGFVYRGHLSVILYLVYLMEYKKIVLMGIDFKNGIHFYDYYPQMHWQFKTGYSLPVEKKRYKRHGTMEAKDGRPYGIDVYIFALNEFVFKPAHITLYSGSKVSILNAKLPYYNFGKSFRE